MIKFYLPPVSHAPQLSALWPASARPPLTLTQAADEADLQLFWQAGLARFTLHLPELSQPLGHFPADQVGLDALRATLRGAVHWTRVWAWQAPSNGLQLSLRPPDAAVPLRGEWVAELWQAEQSLPFTALATNHREQPLYPVLLYLGAQGEILLAHQGETPLAPGETRSLLDGQAYLPPDGPPEQTERLLLLGHASRQDLSAWQQQGWRPDELPPTDLPGFASADRLTIRLLRPQATLRPESQALGQGNILVQGHPSLRLSLALSHSGTRTRSLAQDSPLSQLPGVELLPLSPHTRALGQPLPDTLEISGIDAQARATVRQQPLRLELREPLDEQSALVPMAFDGEFLLPVGRATRTEVGTVAVEIDHLPEEATRSRSIGQALKLYFIKATKGTPALHVQRVIYGPGDTCEQTDEGLEQAVAQAERILLVIHGIIGNTEEMARSVRFAVEADAYDLVLSLDYENLATPVSETALRLKARLQELGATEKTLDIMAHSMGGLVSRWLIEREGGDRFVRRLLMLGTPNGGSAFSMLAPVIPILIALAANLNSPILGGLVYALQWLNDRSRINTTLSDMDRDSNLLLRLNTSDPVDVPYAIIAGDVRAYQSEAQAWFSRLLDKALSGVGNLVYRQQANDVAVKVPEIFRLPVGKNAHERLLPTHHLIYFSHEPSLAVIRELLLAERWPSQEA